MFSNPNSIEFYINEFKDIILVTTSTLDFQYHETCHQH
jgi:hypothetical protein